MNWKDKIVIKGGEDKKKFGYTDLNSHSSRSNFVFRMNYTSEIDGTLINDFSNFRDSQIDRYFSTLLLK